MLTAEWNWDTAKEVWQEEAREEAAAQYEAQLASRDAYIADRDARIAELERQLSGRR